MTKVTYLYFKESANNHPQLKIILDKGGARRPAWVKLLNLPKIKNYPTIKFLTVQGKYETTHYKLRIGTYYLPINANSEEEKIFHNYVAPEFDKINSANYAIGKFIAQKLVSYKVPLAAKILDLYTATGIVSEELAKLGYQNLTLLDSSEPMLAQVRKKSSLKRAKLICADFFDWKPNQTFDVVICIMAIHYYEDKGLKHFLKQAKKIVRINGLFLCAQPSAPVELAKTFVVLESGTFPFSNKGYTTNLPYFIGKNKRTVK